MARMKPCPHCGHQNERGNVVCDTCGRKFSEKKRKTTTTFDNNIIDNEQKKKKKRSVNKHFDLEFGDYQLKKDFSVGLLILLFFLGFWPGVIYLIFSLEKK